MKVSVENLERERDFYYLKLREVEILCQQHEGENVPFLQQVLDILYKTDDADEFVNPEQNASEHQVSDFSNMLMVTHAPSIPASCWQDTIPA